MSPTRVARNGCAFDRRLVRAARVEGPRDGAERRALMALGLSSAMTPPSCPQTASASGTTAVIKALGLVVAVGLCGTLAARSFLVGGPHTASSIVAAPVAAQAVVAAPVPSPGQALSASEPQEPSAVETPPALEPTRGESTSSAHVSPAPKAGAATKPSPATNQALLDRGGILTPKAAPRSEPHEASSSAKPSLAAEVALIQQATRALASGEPNVARRVLDTYDHDFPDGLLREEAGVLRAQALARSGNDVAAHDLARKLLVAHPESVLAPRLRAMVGDDSGP
jgi:hypothetical protein